MRVGRAVRDPDLLGDQLIGVGVVLRARHHQRVRRRAQRRVGAVDLEPGGAALEDAEIAEQLVLDALEHEGGARIAARGHAPVVGAMVEALADEADARQLLRRPAVAPPEPAVLAGEAVVVLARPGVPGARAVLGRGAPRSRRAGSGDARSASRSRCRPDTSAGRPAAVAVERVHHGRGMYSGWLPVTTHRVRPQQVEALGVQVLVGDDVVGEARSAPASRR